MKALERRLEQAEVRAAVRGLVGVDEERAKLKALVRGLPTPILCVVVGELVDLLAELNRLASEEPGEARKLARTILDLAVDEKVKAMFGKELMDRALELSAVEQMS